MGYALYYWPNIQGRGEFVRLALEATGTPYRDVARQKGVPVMVKRMSEGPTPSFAPPFLVDGSVMVAQVAAILQYLGPKLGLVPEDAASRLWCHQIQLTITDFVAEVHDTRTRSQKHSAAPAVSCWSACRNICAGWSVRCFGTRRVSRI